MALTDRGRHLHDLLRVKQQQDEEEQDRELVEVMRDGVQWRIRELVQECESSPIDHRMRLLFSIREKLSKADILKLKLMGEELGVDFSDLSVRKVADEWKRTPYYEVVITVRELLARLEASAKA